MFLANLNPRAYNRNMSNFWPFFRQIFNPITPAVGSMTTFLLEIMEPRYAFFVKHKNMLKYWIIFELLHFIQLAILGNFKANFCPVHSSRWLSDRIFAWNHGRQIFSFWISQKICASFEIRKFLQKTTKNSQIWGKFGILSQIRTNRVLNKW